MGQQHTLHELSGLSTLDLNSLLETSKVLNSSLELDFILSHILRTVMGKLLLTRAAILTIPDEDKPNHYHLSSSRGLAKASKEITDIDAFSKEFDLNLFIPIASVNRKLGLVALGKKFNQQTFSESEKIFVESLASLAASAIENAFAVLEMRELNRSLDQTVQKLKTLFELTNQYSLELNREHILKILIRTISAELFIKQYALCFLEDEIVVIESEKGLDATSFSESELKSIFDCEAPVELTSETYPLLYQSKVRIAIPLRTSDKTHGLLLCGERITKVPFSNSDLDFASLASAQAANALEQIRMLEETLERQAIEKEMQVAYEIQSMLLPKSLPKVEGFEIAAKNIPSRQIGGDYYDVIVLDDSHIFFAIADVTGKGTPAALLMSNLQATIKAYMKSFSSEQFDLASVVGKINDIIYENTPADKFITFFCGILNTKSRTMQSINAGHNPPYLLRAKLQSDEQPETLNTGGVILGVIPTMMPYESQLTTLEKNDVLFMFTDGITEAMSEHKIEFGEVRLEKLLKSEKGKSAQHILDSAIHAAVEYQPEGEQYDDITAVCLKLT